MVSVVGRAQAWVGSCNLLDDWGQSSLGHQLHEVELLPTILDTSFHSLISLFRVHGLPIVHTREAHRPDLSDCPPAKRLRGKPGLRIGDLGAMGRILVAGEPGNQILPELAPVDGEIVIDKPGKGSFWATA